MSRKPLTPEQQERRREQLRQSNLRRRKRDMATPEAREALRAKRRRERLSAMASPERCEAQRARGRRNQAAYYERNKGDPNFVDKKRALQRVYNNSDSGKTTKARFLATEKGRAYLALRNASTRARAGNSSTALAHVEAMRRALLSDEVYALANRLVPKSLPPFVRDDVISDLCIGVLGGEFLADDMAKHVKAVTARHRGLTSSFAVSLDDVLGEKGYTRGHAMGVY